MNKKILVTLAIIMIFAASSVVYTTVYYTDKPLSTALDAPAAETPAEDSIENIENPEEADTSPDTEEVIAAVEDEQTQKVTAVETVEENPPAASQSTVNEVPKTAASTTAVSRGTQSTNTYKYPQLSIIKGSYGQFYYRDLSGGRIEIDPLWIADNIVTITLPGLNQQVQVNKKAADNFIKAFNYIKNGTAVVNGRQVSLLSLVWTMDGTFVARHVNWNPSKGLSNHSWGTAIDINADSHFRYVDPDLEPNDPNLILWEKAFKPAGFSWGNSYSDSMHFELLD